MVEIVSRREVRSAKAVMSGLEAGMVEGERRWWRRGHKGTWPEESSSIGGWASDRREKRSRTLRVGEEGRG